jgi:hypothetical protein
VLFFKPATGGGQIGGIDERQSRFGGIELFDHRIQQVGVDFPQTVHPDVFPKGMEHPHVRHVRLVGQVGKVTPSFLFGQQTNQEIKGMYRGDVDPNNRPAQRGIKVPKNRPCLSAVNAIS